MMLATKRCLPARIAVTFLLTAAVLPALAADGPQTVTVTIQGTAYSPVSAKIHVGDTIVWTNADDQDYTVVAADGSFSSGNIGSGKTFSHEFPKAGTFSYFCKYHPRMKGSVVVADH
jgi:plastocyanin